MYGRNDLKGEDTYAMAFLYQPIAQLEMSDISCNCTTEERGRHALRQPLSASPSMRFPVKKAIYFEHGNESTAILINGVPDSRMHYKNKSLELYTCGEENAYTHI